MNTVEIIRKKRDKNVLSRDEINYMITSFTKGKIPDYQFSSFLMTICINGMTVEETAYLTECMLYSGKVVDLTSIKGIKIDKHSTGGVGDKTSLLVAPIAAAAGVIVPMIAGRGLGHTGGTLDKLDAIPGMSTNLNLQQYRSSLKKIGVVMSGQTKEIAPADKVIYALRDVTATIESIPLITASIMSKKLAEGMDGLVMDVKTGSGAFMKEYKNAKLLAQSIFNTAKQFKKKAIGFITDMNQPLGNYIGNWLEVVECIEIMQDKWVDDLCELSFTLSGAMIYLAGKAASIEEGFEISKRMIKEGKAFDKFLQIIKMQGGDISYLKDTRKYPESRVHIKISANKEGYLNSIENYELGMIGLELGAGRKTKEDIIDPKAGIIFHKKLGEKINKNDILAEFFTDKKNKVEALTNKFYNTIKVTNDKSKKLKLVKEIIT
jgi:pyrimidine-nucleoside phosphorylase